MPVEVDDRLGGEPQHVPHLELRFSEGPRTEHGFVPGKNPAKSDIALVNKRHARSAAAIAPSLWRAASGVGVPEDTPRAPRVRHPGVERETYSIDLYPCSWPIAGIKYKLEAYIRTGRAFSRKSKTFPFIQYLSVCERETSLAPK